MSLSGTHQKRNVPKKGFFPNLVETAGYTLAQAFQKSALGHTPLLISFTRYTLEQKKNNLDVWEEPRGNDTRNRFFIWSRFDGKHRRRRKALSPFWSSISNNTIPWRTRSCSTHVRCTHTIVIFQTRIRRNDGAENFGDFVYALDGFTQRDFALWVFMYPINIIPFRVYSVTIYIARAITPRATTPLPPLHGYHACVYIPGSTP